MSVVLQKFKPNEEFEQKIIDSALPTLQILSGDRDQFYADAYEAYPLGGVLWDLGRTPLRNSVPREVYRTSYPAIHQLFTRPGTFEFYLEVFQAVWGEDVDVEFTIPGPGKLEIGIHAIETSLDPFFARRIEDNTYFYDQMVDHDGNRLVFQGSKGLRTQAELDALIREISPNGIYVTATLEIE